MAIIVASIFTYRICVCISYLILQWPAAAVEHLHRRHHGSILGRQSRHGCDDRQLAFPYTLGGQPWLHVPIPGRKVLNFEDAGFVESGLLVVAFHSHSCSLMVNTSSTVTRHWSGLRDARRQHIPHGSGWCNSCT